MRRPALALTALLAGLADGVPAEAAIFKVGSDGACTHSSITGAVFSAIVAGADEVRLARNLAYTNEHVHLTNWNAGNELTISGGWDSCSDTSPSGTTTVDGTSSPVFEVDTSGANESIVTLRRLAITGSSARGLLVEDGASVTLERSTISDNTPGGGIAVIGGTLYIDFFTSVYDNDAQRGGGISCDDGGHLLLSGVVGTSGHPNEANEGGGIWAGHDCIVDLLDGALVQYNYASDSGGGIRASDTAQVNATTGGTVSISHNSVNAGGGGGLAAVGYSTVQLLNTWVLDNSAYFGGGFYVDEFAKLTMDQDDDTCVGTDCSRLSSNMAGRPSSPRSGAAAFIAGGTKVDVFRTLVSSNTDAAQSSGSGAVFLVQAPNHAQLRFDGVTMYANDARTLVWLEDLASAEMAFITAARNGRFAPDFGIAARPVAVGGSATADVWNSIFWPSDAFVVDFGGDLVADCLIVSVALPPGAGVTNISTLDPQLRDVAAGNLRPGPFSPAIDFCNYDHHYPVRTDRDGDLRGYDMPMNPDGSPGPPDGFVELGSDEVRDFVFYDDVELGNTTRWQYTHSG